MLVDRVIGFVLLYFFYVLKMLFVYFFVVMLKLIFNFELKYYVSGINVDYELYGVVVDGINRYIVDVSKGRKMKYYVDKMIINFLSFIICGIDVEFFFLKMDIMIVCSVCLVEFDSYVGYCWLVLVFNNECMWIIRFVCLFGSVYLKVVNILENIKNILKVKGILKYFWGYKCFFFLLLVRKEW